MPRLRAVVAIDRRTREVVARYPSVSAAARAKRFAYRKVQGQCAEHRIPRDTFLMHRYEDDWDPLGFRDPWLVKVTRLSTGRVAVYPSQAAAAKAEHMSAMSAYPSVRKGRAVDGDIKMEPASPRPRAKGRRL